MTPDKRVEEIVEQFFRIQNSIWETTTKIELAKRQERELLRTTLTNYHQDLMKEVVEKLEGMKPILWNDNPNRYLENVAKHNVLTEAQNIIKSLSK